MNYNYPYLAGRLHGMLVSLANYSTPGLKVTDAAAYRGWAIAESKRLRENCELGDANVMSSCMSYAGLAGALEGALRCLIYAGRRHEAVGVVVEDFVLFGEWIHDEIKKAKDSTAAYSLDIKTYRS
jgi:hypothetical protein